MNNKVIWAIVAIVVIVGGIYLLGMNTSTKTETSTAPTSSKTMGRDGRVVFAVTDAAVNMSTISEINMRVSRLDVHSQASGWVTVSSTPHTYNLLELNAKKESRLLADVAVKADTYDQVRVMVDSVSVRTKAGATKEAVLPAKELTINSRLIVNGGSTSSATFDFLADKALITSTSGTYVFAPVVKTETKSNVNASIDATGVVALAGGTVNDSSTVGMDVNGDVKLNFLIGNDEKLNIGSDNSITVEGALDLK